MIYYHIEGTKGVPRNGGCSSAPSQIIGLASRTRDCWVRFRHIYIYIYIHMYVCIYIYIYQHIRTIYTHLWCILFISLTWFQGRGTSEFGSSRDCRMWRDRTDCILLPITGSSAWLDAPCAQSFQLWPSKRRDTHSAVNTLFHVFI